MKKRLLALVLAVYILLSCLPCAVAESFRVYITDNNLKIYAKPSSSAKVLGTMGYGENLICLDTEENWAKVKNAAGDTGYCKISSLSTSDPNTLRKKIYINTEGTKVHKRPNAGSDVLMTLKRNDSYTAVAITDDEAWLRLKNGKYYGYIQTEFASDTKTYDDNADDSLSGSTVYITENTMKVYKEASSSSKTLGALSFGESLTLLGVDGSWARVKNPAGAIGYCRFSALSTSNPNKLNRTVYINRDGTSIYANPLSNSKVIATGNSGDVLTAVSESADGDWLRVKKGGSYGYVPVKYISAEKIPDDTEPEEETPSGSTAYISANTLKVYKEASSSSKALGTLSYGESLILLDVSGSWARVKNPAGNIGYCRFSSLVTSNPNTKDLTAYAKANGVKIYAKPLESAKVLHTLDRNDSIGIVAVTPDEDWARAYLGSGRYGYARTSDLRDSRVEDDTPEGDGLQDMRAATMYVLSTNISCYTTPSTSSNSLGTLSFGESVTATGKGNGWFRVENAAGRVAYCQESGLSASNPNKYSIALYPKKEGVKIYEGASSGSAVLSTAGPDKKLTGVAISADKNWIRLKNGSDYGYVKADDVSQQSPEDEGSKAIQAVISLAKDQMGKKYVYGADGPSQFDCSSLTQYSFKKAAGVSLNRTAQQQGYDSLYKKISSVSELKVGDLVFFNTNDGDSDLCDHVGIYLGSRQFIHASSAAGKVIISSLSSGYYNRTFSWGMRVM